MLRYNIKTGVSKIKTKTAIAISAVTLVISGAGMAVMVPTLSHAAVPTGPVTTSTGGGGGWNPPTDSCDAGHGAFKYFSDPSQHFTSGQPPYFGDDQLGSARAGVTGAVQKAASEACNQ